MKRARTKWSRKHLERRMAERAKGLATGDVNVSVNNAFGHKASARTGQLNRLLVLGAKKEELVSILEVTPKFVDDHIERLKCKGVPILENGTGLLRIVV